MEAFHGLPDGSRELVDMYLVLLQMWQGLSMKAPRGFDDIHADRVLSDWLLPDRRLWKLRSSEELDLERMLVDVF